MGKRGPLPKSKREAELSSARVRSRNPERRREPKRRLPDPPAYLNGEGRRVFRRIARLLRERGTLAPEDHGTLGRYARLWERWRKVEEQLDELEDFTTESHTGTVHAHPLVRMAAELAIRLEATERLLGLTPAARDRLAAPAEEPEEDAGGDSDVYRISFR